MKTLMSTLALTVAGAMLATSALAQSGTGGASGSAGSSSAPGASSGSPAGKGSSPSTTPAPGTGADSDTKSSGAGSMSSSDMKSGSEAMKSHRAAGGGAGSEQVKALQQALKDKGHDPGDIDGKMGPKTQAALREYQQKEGLTATGRLDSATAQKLGVQAQAETSSSSPAASPSTK